MTVVSVVTLGIAIWLGIGLLTLLIILCTKGYWESVQDHKLWGLGNFIYNTVVGVILIVVCGPLSMMELHKEGQLRRKVDY
jgi:hypothetical protein